MKSIIFFRKIAKWKIGTNALKGYQRFLSSQARRSVITQDFEVISPFPDVAPKMEGPVQLVINAAQRWSHLTAFECGLTGLSYSYGRLLDGMLNFSGFLQSTGIGRGDVVAILSFNNLNSPWIYFGIMMSGAAFSGINTAFNAYEVKCQLQDSGAKAVVVSPYHERVVVNAIADLANPPMVYVTGASNFGNVNLFEAIGNRNTTIADLPELRADDICGLMYSSNATEVPKGAVFRHSVFSSHMPMLLHPEIFPIEPTTSEHQETVIGLMPFSHWYGMYVVMIASLLLGIKVVTVPMFHLETFVALHKKHKVKVMHAVPPILQILADNPLVKPEDLTHARVVLNTSAPCPTDVVHAFKNKVPNPIFFQDVYGMTETLPTHFTPIKGQEKIGSCGSLLPNTRAKIVNLNTGASLPHGETGELYIKSPVAIREFHNRPEATSKIYTKDGWLKTGDLAKYDKDGYFYINDRVKTKEIETPLSDLDDRFLQHPAGPC